MAALIQEKHCIPSRASKLFSENNKELEFLKE